MNPSKVAPKCARTALRDYDAGDGIVSHEWYVQGGSLLSFYLG
jgi:hypothetical protein